MKVAIAHLGCAGHFIGSENCQFRRHTQIATAYRVSTVGDYYPPSPEKRQAIGAGGFYFETMVFRTKNEPCKDGEGCGCYEVASWCEIDARRYETAGEAQKGHDAMVAKYAKMLRKVRVGP